MDEEGKYKKKQTFLHKGGVQEFVELMCKDKQHLHPEMKVNVKQRQLSEWQRHFQTVPVLLLYSSG